MVALVGCDPAPATSSDTSSAGAATAATTAGAWNGPGWSYDHPEKTLTTPSGDQACVTSEAPVRMGPPYGDTLLQLCLVQGRGPRFPSTISFVGDGQFLCPIDGCQIAAKFDDGPTLRLHADDEAGDGSDHTLFFTRGSSAKLIAEVRRAKRATFALEIYDNGEQDISFDVHGLSPTEFPPRAAARKAR